LRSGAKNSGTPGNTPASHTVSVDRHYEGQCYYLHTAPNEQHMLEFKTHHGRDRVQRMGVRAALPACLAAALAAAGRVPSRWERVP
jgi:hypothetical protein